MENIFFTLKSYISWILMAFGLLVLVGAIRNWNWIVTPTERLRNSFLGSFVKEMWGNKGIRVLTGIIGFLLFAIGVLYLVIEKVYNLDYGKM